MSGAFCRYRQVGEKPDKMQTSDEARSLLAGWLVGRGKRRAGRHSEILLGWVDVWFELKIWGINAGLVAGGLH